MITERNDYAEERAKWRAFKRRRPPDIVTPGPDQESVWDYPRPPRLEPVAQRVWVEFASVRVADSTRALRVLETSSPPTYYIPAADVTADCLEPVEGTTFCEWKGVAHYWHLRVGDRVSERAAWSYPQPDSEFAAIRDHFAFFAGRVGACYVGDDRVMPQPGDYYGGWVTSNIVGPFKGDPGTQGW